MGSEGRPRGGGPSPGRRKNASTMNFKLPTFYKRLLAILVVIGPFYWLLFTEDGRRRTDAVMLRLSGEKEISLNLKALDNRFTDDELKQVFPDIEWKCQNQTSDFGNRLCTSRIGVYNGIPSRFITVYFQERRISAVRLIYRPNYHEQLLLQLRQQLGQPQQLESDRGEGVPQPGPILRWDTGKGIVILKQQLAQQDEPALIWLTD